VVTTTRTLLESSGLLNRARTAPMKDSWSLCP